MFDRTTNYRTNLATNVQFLATNEIKVFNYSNNLRQPSIYSISSVSISTGIDLSSKTGLNVYRKNRNYHEVVY